MKVCDLCGSAARMYCESDRASLCWGCDAKVHGANFLVARHLRTLLCHACQTPTPWKASGARLGPTVSVCVDGAVDGCGRRESREGDEWSRRSGSHGGENEQSEEDDSEEGENWGGDDSEEEEDEADNQVVPRRCTPPPPSPSSSSSEDSPSRLFDSGGDEPHQRRFSVKRSSPAFQDDVCCSSSASPRQQRSSASCDAPSSSNDFFRRPSKHQRRSNPVWAAVGSSSTAAIGPVDPSLAGGRGTSKADA